MADFLQRAQAPLSTDEWENIDKIVVDSAHQQLVGRSFLDLFGPIGAGHQFVPRLALAGVTPASADDLGQGGTPVTVSARTQLPLTIIHKDFTLHWRDVETARQSGLPLDLGAAAAASTLCAAREDELIFHGDKTLGIDGLTTVSGHRTMTRRDWGIAGHAFLDIVEAIDHMAVAGFYPPYALICSPNLFACLLRVSGTSGVLELNQARELCTAGVLRSMHVKSAVLLAVGPHNVDLVVGQDLTVAYVRVENMDYVFRVMETLALRIKRPAAICSLVPRTASPTHRVRRGVPEEATGGGD
jgi:uncharacterized linocin/CFP29 family protein